MGGSPAEGGTRNGWLVGGSLLLLVAACWSWIVPMALDMHGEMTGPAAWMMTTRWDGRHQLLLLAMWAVMMAAMMLPSALPAVFRYATRPREPAGDRSGVRAYAFVAGYLAVWTLFGVAATIAHRVLTASMVLTPMMEPATPAFAAGLLMAAGAYQLLPFKRRCLASCHADGPLVAHDRRPGAAGAFRIGMRYGRACLASGWLLMLLLFAGGVMNLAPIAALTVVVLVEKVGPFGPRSTYVSGALSIGLGLWVLAR